MPSSTPHIVSTPVDLDRHIEAMKIQLANISWLDRVYGLAEPTPQLIGDNETIIYPRVYDGTREFSTVTTDDELQAKSFFYIPSSINYNRITNRFDCIIRLIVTVNVNVLNAALNSEYSIHSLVKDIKNLNMDGVGGLTPSSEENYRRMNFVAYYYSKVEDVFSDFTFWQQDTKYRTHPLNMFRMDFDMEFNGDC